MKLLFIIVFITLINYSFCSINRGKYLELDKGTTTAYLVAENCEKIYICGKQDTDGWWIFGDDILKNCYYRNKSVDDINLDDDKYDNPDNCPGKRYAYVSSNSCSLLSDGVNKISGKTLSKDALYYDMDTTNKRVLTEWGWCTYRYDQMDSNWMSYVKDDLKLNQINIPGTHDSGTYDISKSWKLDKDLSDAVLMGSNNRY
ncbi:hypothetical protein H8356DRAFT_957624 [Neocallimastix lanati (nom. inval.)]|jgi:hypothetical protein|uniref:PLC-like phosphodiesterase n=1 Tax=Neocallimastix californiae TaxID=1754190 RepID=A0A1Y2F450_9FUNG|nr:hypothetical protein H8356DRAFT_957624 [Neocallimastix sp. JGI-2020a]ORY78264.1 hypothetical protein LY90DRAFT_501025 [Neocallimastix californiae]|eukprot:ORY78264.1 hypothetical protein LY90DRAFT_501025 [Neocallimastix californiae]